MRLRRQSSGEIIRVDTALPLGKGGEARVYGVTGDGTLAVKVYEPDKIMSERVLKLAVMRDNPPDVPTGKSGHVPIAWPLDLLCDPENGERVMGFLMGRVHDAAQVIDVYNPQNRLRETPLFDYRYLIRTSRNLAAAVRALHARGYVIGDLKHSNVLVTQTALVTLVDTDSFQVRDPQTDRVFACPVRTPDFTPPELQETDKETRRQGDRGSQVGINSCSILPSSSLQSDVLLPEHDLFALGVLVFHLLMEGTHPFAGVYLDEGDPPPFEERIASGHFPYGTQAVPYRPSTRHAPPFALLPPTLRELFVRCFEEGHVNPTARPDAKTWQAALDGAGRSLARCGDNPQHFYGNHLAVCPWCERKQTQLRGIDPFPSEQAVLARSKAVASANATASTAAPTANAPAASTSPPAPSMAPFWAIAAGAFGIFCIFMASISGQPSHYAAPSSYSAYDSYRSSERTEVPNYTPLYTPTFPALPASRPTYPPENAVISVAYSPDGKTIAGSENNDIVLWDAQMGRVKRRIAAHQGRVWEIAFAPDGKTLASDSEDKRVKVWNAQTGECLHTLPSSESSEPVTSFAFSPNGKTLATVTHRSNLVRLWDVNTNALLKTRAVNTGEVTCVRFSPNGKLLAAVGHTPTEYDPNSEGSILIHLTVFDASMKKIRREEQYGLSAHSPVAQSLAFSPDSKTVALDGPVCNVWNISAGSVTHTTQWAAAGEPISRSAGTCEHRAVVYSPKGDLMANTLANGDIVVWNTRKDVWKLTIPLPDNHYDSQAAPAGSRDVRYSLAFSPDGKVLATASNQGVSLWDARTGSCLRQFNAESEKVDTGLPSEK